MPHHKREPLIYLKYLDQNNYIIATITNVCLEGENEAAFEGEKTTYQAWGENIWAMWPQNKSNVAKV